MPPATAPALPPSTPATWSAHAHTATVADDHRGQPTGTIGVTSRQPVHHPTRLASAWRLHHPHRRRRPAAAVGRRTRPQPAVLCGVGNVLIHYPPTVARDIETRHGLPPGKLRTVMLEAPSSRLAAAGLLDHDAWLRHLRCLLPAGAVREWLAYHGQPDPDVLTILQAAPRLVLLSTTYRVRDTLAHHGLDRLADHMVTAADAGLAKPDPRAYRHALAAAALPPQRTLYVDDNPGWVDVGRWLGMRGHVHTSIDHLRAALHRAGMPQ